MTEQITEELHYASLDDRKSREIIVTNSTRNSNDDSNTLSDDSLSLLPLAELFHRASKLYVKVTLHPSNNIHQHSKEQLTAIQLLQHLHSRSEYRQCWSSNEEIDDITTAQLKYILVPYYLGELLIAKQGSEERLTYVLKACVRKQYFNISNVCLIVDRNVTCLFVVNI